MPSLPCPAEMLARSPIVILNEEIVLPLMLTETQVELFFPDDVEVEAHSTLNIDTGIFFKIPEGKVLATSQVPGQPYALLLCPQMPVSLKIPVHNPEGVDQFFSRGDVLCQLELIDDPVQNLDLSQEIPPNGYQY